MNQVKILTRSLTEKQLFYTEKTVSAILTGSTEPNSKSVSSEGKPLRLPVRWSYASEKREQ